MCLGDIYYKKAIDGNTDLPVSVSRFAYVFHITEKEAYSQFKELKESLLGKRIFIPKSQFDPAYTFNWITKFELLTNDEVCVNFSDDIIEHISSLDAKFVSFKIEDVQNFKSSHTFRIYEIVKSAAYDNASWRLCLFLDELKNMLCLGDCYNLYGDFKRLLDKCIAEINENTSINVSFQTRKLGKKVNQLVFFIAER
jgi:plasmid replication initiation protein